MASKFTARTQTTHVIVHCTDSPQGRGDTAEDIHRWHLEKGWDAIGYHAVILEDGTTQAGRPLDAVGSHCVANKMNWQSIGVVLIGMGGDATPEQLESLEVFYQDMINLYGKQLQIAGHCDFDPNKPDCPGFDVTDMFYENTLNKIFDDTELGLEIYNNQNV